MSMGMGVGPRPWCGTARSIANPARALARVTRAGVRRSARRRARGRSTPRPRRRGARANGDGNRGGDSAVDQGRLHALPLRAGAGVLGVLGPPELPLVLRHRALLTGPALWLESSLPPSVMVLA